MFLFRKNAVDSLPHKDWLPLSKEEELEEILAESHQGITAIFKHSTRCSISSMVREQLANNWTFDPNELRLYHLDLIQFRAISNAIAEKTEVKHQSPQLIALHKGEVIYEASHNNISADKLMESITKIG